MKYIEYFQLIFLQKVLYILTELISGGTLREQLVVNPKVFTEDTLKFVACELTSGLLYLHRQNILHRFEPLS